MRWKSWLGNRNVLLGMGSLALGASAYLLAQRYLHTQEAAVRERLAASYPTREVLVARGALPAGAMLEPPMLARRAVPERFLASDAIGADGAAAALGRPLARALHGGEPVTESSLAGATDVRLSSLVEPGLRALTIPVDESGGAAGLLSPGDLVDLLLVARAEDSAAGAVSVRPLLQAVPVVATGQQLQRRAAGGERDEANARIESSYATVTLHVRPEDAARVLLAQRVGELAILLRPAGERAPAMLQALSEASLFGTPAAPGAARGPRLARVQFIIGGLGQPLHGRAQAAASARRAQP